MGQVHQRGEPQFRRLRSQRRAGLGQRREFGVGRRDDDQFGRGLAQIDRLRAVGDLTGLGEEQVHQSNRFSMKTL